MMPVMMPVKVCGLTRLEDAQLAARLGAWALGFIFYESSPRYVAPERVAEIVSRIPKGVLTVGVFVNASGEQIRKVIEKSGVSRVQLHGDEDPAIAESIPVPFFRAIRPKKPADLEQIGKWPSAEYVLVDAAVEGLYGGTGQTSDWQLSANARSRGKVILSGGLKPENVEEAIRQVRPFALDVSSGIEERPGIKDTAKMNRFFEAVKEAVKRGSA